MMKWNHNTFEREWEIAQNLIFALLCAREEATGRQGTLAPRREDVYMCKNLRVFLYLYWCKSKFGNGEKQNRRRRRRRR